MKCMMNARRSRYALSVFLVSACAAASAAACASAPAVPLRGSPTAVAALVGEWNGTYDSRDTGRSGSIWFKLIAGEDHAHGDVLMTPRGAVPYWRHAPGTGRKMEMEPPSQFLTIRFVRVRDNEVRGVLEPYWDPSCQCQAVTTFQGQLAGDRLRGAFDTRLDSGGRSSGQWEVTRSRDASR
jgi:hypothetical protein